MNARTLRILVLCAVAALPLRSVMASTDPVLARGFNPNQVYSFEGFDSVNALNGHLQMQVPLGHAYKTNGTLQYSFVLHYDSNFWTYVNHDLSIGPGAAETGSHLQLRNNAVPIDSGESQSQPTLEAYPSSRDNAGFGWHLSLGELRDMPAADWVQYPSYVDESGAQHAFTGAGPLPAGFHGPYWGSGNAVMYTQDGSNLRMRVIDDNTNTRIVDFPDGTHKTFRCFSNCQQVGKHRRWMLMQIADDLGNTLDVTRSQDTPPQQPTTDWTWTLTERAKDPAVSGIGEIVRQHRLVFRVVNGRELLIRAELAATGANTAIYRLDYDDVQLPRPSGADYPASSNESPGLNGCRMFNASRLRSVTLPNAANGAAAGEWFFEYDTGLPPCATPPLMAVPTHTTSGLLQVVTLPTGGKVRYDWGRRLFPQRRCGLGGAAPNYSFYRATSVVRRQMLDRNDQPVGEPWLYGASEGAMDPGTSGPTAPDCGEAEEWQTVVVDPLGNATVTFYRLFRKVLDNDGRKHWFEDEHSLPFSNLSSDPADGTLGLSSRVYQCRNVRGIPSLQGDGGIDGPYWLLDPRDPADCGLPFRETFVRYVNQGPPCGTLTGPSCRAADARLVTEKIAHHAVELGDGATQGEALSAIDSYTRTDHSGYDGFGHFLTTVHSGSMTAANAKTQTSAYSQSITGTTWLLDLLTRKQTTIPPISGHEYIPVSSIVTYQYDMTTGLPEERRELAGDTPSARDLRVTFRRERPDGTSMRTIERYYGGDLQNQDSPQYVIARTYRYGEVARTEYRDCPETSVFVPRETNGIDAGSGLVVWSDPSGDQAEGPSRPARTSFEYDLLGRLTKVQPPPGEDALHYEYARATGSSPATVSAYRTNRTAGPESVFVYDGFGRMTAERTLQMSTPTQQQWTEVARTWLANGWLEKESTRHAAGGSSGETLYADWDPFGRPRRIVKPDGKQVSILHTGTHLKKTRTSGLARDENPRSADVYEEYDGFGRLARVSESSAGNVATDYRYDVRGNLALVQPVESGGTPRNLPRLFLYDSMGLLRFETYPELGANRRVAHHTYDSRGNAGGKRIERYSGSPASGATAVDRSLFFTYDAAERLTDVSFCETASCGNGQYKRLEEFRYYGAEADPRWNWKLKEAVRVNHHVDPRNRPADPASPGAPKIASPVSTTYEYAAPGGQKTAITLTTPAFTSRTAMTYDNFGSLSTITYPTVTGCATCPARVVQMKQSRGTLTDIVSAPNMAGLLSGSNSRLAWFEYYPNGVPSFIHHGNGTSDEQLVAADMLPRVLRIRTAFTGSAPATIGPYTYDGAGNVSAIGNDVFRYDQVGRLTRSVVSGVEQVFHYDRYGNMVRPGVTTDTPTNRYTGTGFAYDAAGNLIEVPDQRPGSTRTLKLAYDPLDAVTVVDGQSSGRVHLYDADNERVGTYDYSSPDGVVRELWAIRGADPRVIRDITRTGSGSLTWATDYVHRPAGLLATFTPASNGAPASHFHLDHLGTPRHSSRGFGAIGTRESTATYLPFGEETVTAPAMPRLRFTGHERDDDGTANQQIDLDYMHARYFSANLRRFLSVDPIGGEPGRPQTWNRYAYALNGPINLIDPTGKDERTTEADHGDTVQERVRRRRHGQERARDKVNQAAEAGQMAGMDPRLHVNWDRIETRDAPDPVGGEEMGEDLSNLTIAFYDNLGVADLDWMNAAKWVAKVCGDKDYARRADLTDKDSGHYTAGEGLGMAFTAYYFLRALRGGGGGPATAAPRVMLRRGSVGADGVTRWPIP